MLVVMAGGIAVEMFMDVGLISMLVQMDMGPADHQPPYKGHPQQHQERSNNKFQ
jgi:hypothetical protein